MVHANENLSYERLYSFLMPAVPTHEYLYIIVAPNAMQVNQTLRIHHPHATLVLLPGPGSAANYLSQLPLVFVPLIPYLAYQSLLSGLCFFPALEFPTVGLRPIS